MQTIDTWDPRRLNRFLVDLETRRLKRELTFEEEKLCNEIYFFSPAGFKKTRQLMMRALAKHWRLDIGRRPVPHCPIKSI